MKTKFFILIGMLLIGGSSYAQTSAILDCGWSYYYDNAGNRTARLFRNCNRPPQAGKTDETDSTTTMVADSTKIDVLEEIDIVTLYPNPTRDAFKIEFNNALDNADITVTNNEGRLVYREKASGTFLTIDLSGQAASTYHVVVRRNADKVYRKTVVKID